MQAETPIGDDVTVSPDGALDPAPFSRYERELHTDHLLNNIGDRTVRGGALVLAAQAIKAVLQFGAVVVLVRLLPPAAFGLVAMTAALGAILDPIRELGFSWATIQKPDLTHAQASTLFWINASAGVLVGTGLAAAAPAIAAFYQQPDLLAVTRWMAAGFLLSGFGVQHWALLRRQMRFGAVAGLDTTAEIAGFVAAVILALNGAGYWALVAQRLIPGVLVLSGSWTLCRWRPGLPSRTPGLRALFAFGGSVTGTTILSLLSRNVDQVLIGWLWGPVSLGLYERASKLMMVPLMNVCTPFYSIGMPMLSRLSEQAERYRRAFHEMMEKLAMITLPGAALLMVTADWVTGSSCASAWPWPTNPRS
jgi:PST family polysaccharide transporter